MKQTQCLLNNLTFELCMCVFYSYPLQCAYEDEDENESLLIPAVQHDIYHRIKFKNKIDLRLT